MSDQNCFRWDANMKKLGSKCGTEFEPRVEEWMKDHTIGDLRNLALSIENKGEDATEVLNFISDLCALV